MLLPPHYRNTGQGPVTVVCAAGGRGANIGAGTGTSRVVGETGAARAGLVDLVSRSRVTGSCRGGGCLQLSCLRMSGLGACRKVCHSPQARGRPLAAPRFWIIRTALPASGHWLGPDRVPRGVDMALRA